MNIALGCGDRKLTPANKLISTKLLDNFLLILVFLMSELCCCVFFFSNLI